MTVGVIGSGCAGMTAARQLARQGYKVTVYEAMPVPSGMMWAGVPEWRLPRDVIMEEIEIILDLGIELKLNTRSASTSASKSWSPITTPS